MGQPVSAELPNITGGTGLAGNSTPCYGFFRVINTSSRTKTSVGGTASGTTWEIQCGASRCSSIYKDSATTVVPESLITNFYIRY